mmetsp:Transcript_140796/g.366557  ORF Transcript_140796/g.366557 Transcript_140796/m.366557 type:complete len:625 (-) Transcript_140796:100-1974(-)
MRAPEPLGCPASAARRCQALHPPPPPPPPTAAPAGAAAAKPLPMPLVAPFLRFFALLALLLAPPGACDEMAFVDVSSTDSINIRQLDGGYVTKKGLAGLFVDDPMAPHDWTLTKVVQATLKAELAAGELSQSKVGLKIKHLEEVALRPLYAAMPKNEHGLLDRGAARYLAHRYFAGTRGWSIKGLEPAGAAWLKTVPVTQSVRQLTKWIVPTFLFEEVLHKLGKPGFDLRGMAIFVSTIEHLIHAEMTEMLYSVHRTMQVPISGDKSAEEVDLLVSVFMMVYALGVNLELSTKHDLHIAKDYLETTHQAWPELIAWTRSFPGRADLTTSGFDGLLRFVESLAEEYSRWQERDCARAKAYLLKAETDEKAKQDGRADLAQIEESREHGYRSLFVESINYLKKLGVLDYTDPEHPQLVVPNYLVSQTMCLTTASFYTVCCHNACDEVLSELEVAAGAPSAPAEEVIRALQASGRNIESALLEELRAENRGGEVRLHGASFGAWLHRAFPNECADAGSGEFAHTNPKTADQWMSDPGSDVQETEDLISEVAIVLHRFATLGLDANTSSALAESPDREAEQEVEASFSVDDARTSAPVVAQRASMFDLGLRSAAILSALGLAVAICWR